jgi:large subunit ribosomal protein L21e
MAKRVRGNRGGHSRQQLRRHRQKTTVNKLLQEFKVGENVIIDLNSEIQAAMPHPRYQGYIGTIIAKRGSSYEIGIMDGDKKKIIVTSPAHIKKTELAKKADKAKKEKTEAKEKKEKKA